MCCRSVDDQQKPKEKPPLKHRRSISTAQRTEAAKFALGAKICDPQARSLSLSQVTVHQASAGITEPADLVNRVASLSLAVPENQAAAPTPITPRARAVSAAANNAIISRARANSQAAKASAIPRSGGSIGRKQSSIEKNLRKEFGTPRKYSAPGGNSSL
jgi:hypothetical protein